MHAHPEGTKGLTGGCRAATSSIGGAFRCLEYRSPESTAASRIKMKHCGCYGLTLVDTRSTRRCETNASKDGSGSGSGRTISITYETFFEESFKLRIKSICPRQLILRSKFEIKDRIEQNNNLWTQ